MKSIRFFVILSCCLSASAVFAAEKNKTLNQLDAARSIVETASIKTEGNKDAAADLERAKIALKNADESYNAGKSYFSDINPETEKEIKMYVTMAEIAAATALSRVELVRAAAELEAIEKQFVTVSAKLKLFEERMTELKRLRLESAELQKTSRELEAVKAEKAALASQVEKLAAERSRADKLKSEQLELNRNLDELKAENERLSYQLGIHPSEIKSQPALSVKLPDDSDKKTPKKP
jgi:septal ring factor EnvC (AmiA/AmiB activator)